MTKNSLLCNLINDHPSDWERICADKHIKVKRKDDLAIFNYDSLAVDWRDPLVCEARGIIINVSTCKVVCWPFSKFFNVQEEWAAPINWNTARVEQKIDGSIIKLWCYKGSWHWSTNGNIDASEAVVDDTNITFMDVIKKAEEYQAIVDKNFELDSDFTYIFELVSPYTRVVIYYPTTHLYYTGVRSNLTGEEYQPCCFPIDDKVKTVERYPLHSYEECIAAADALNQNGVISDEGFVVVDDKFNRVKIKSPEYVMLHRTKSGGPIKYKDYLDEINNRHAPYAGVNAIAEKYYEYKLAELIYKVDLYVFFCRRLYEEYDYSRGAVANKIKNDKFACYGFKALDNHKTAEEIVKENIKYSKNFIDDYKVNKEW